MKPRELIAKSWEITKRERALRKWGFVAALLATMLNAKLFTYQAWFFYSYFIRGDPIGFFAVEEAMMEALPFGVFVGIIIFIIVLLIIEWLFPHVAKGAIIGLAAKSYRGEELKGGMVLGIYNFFSIFAVHELLVLSSLTNAITLASLALRYLGDAAPIAITILAVVWFLSNVMEFFWIFAEEAIVIRKEGVRKAIRVSFKLVISYFSHILFLMLLLIIIILRIVANLLMVILVPAIVLGLGIMLTSFLTPVLSYSIAAILGFAIIAGASYFFAYLEVFRQTVWTLTYIELSKLKELDVIEETTKEE